MSSMILLTPEKKPDFLNTIITLRQQLADLPPKGTLDELNRFENQRALDELEACLTNSEDGTLHAGLVEVFSRRWDRICNRSMCYTNQPENGVNQLYIELAKAVSPPINTKEEIEALAPSEGPYCLLMPSIQNWEDVYSDNIHYLGFHEFVLSDNGCVFIPINACLQQAAISDEGIFRHIVMLNGTWPALTPSEIKRIEQHSKEALELSQAVFALNRQRIWGDNLGSKLNQLASALWEGSVKVGGQEYNAGFQANQGIADFNHYWETVTEHQKKSIFTQTPALEDIIGRLFRPDDANYRDAIYCVQMLSQELDPIANFFKNNPDTKTLEKKVQQLKKVFKSAITHGFTAIADKTIFPPTRILHLIFKLDLSIQKEMFKWDGYENALMYALEREPKALLDFELDAAWKERAITATFGDGNSGLIVATLYSNIEVMRLLLNWGANIEFTNIGNNRALHIAAYRGDVDAVRLLLEHGAEIDALGENDITPLAWAIINKKPDVVALLLENNAEISIQNHFMRNALDLAQEDLMILKPVLLHLVTQPLHKQRECMHTDAIYPNILFFAINKAPQLFDDLVEKVSNHPDKALRDTLFNSVNEGDFLLLRAAKKGAHKSIAHILNSGVDINTTDSKSNTALHWAAFYGHFAAVNYLLEKGASIDEPGTRGTALYLAVFHNKPSITALLLKKNAKIKVGKFNALEKALQKKT